MTKFHHLTVPAIALASALALGACGPKEGPPTAASDGANDQSEATVQQAGDTVESNAAASEGDTEEPAETTDDKQVAMVDPQTESSNTSDEPDWVSFFTSGELQCTERGGTFRLWASADGSLKTKFSVKQPYTGTWTATGPNSMDWELSRGNSGWDRSVTVKMVNDQTLQWGEATCEKN